MTANDTVEILEAAVDPAQQAAHRILVAEDDATLRRLTADMLTTVGHTVDAAKDGAAAWDALQRCRYDLLITDQQMPLLTGVQLVQRLDEAEMVVPVILVSGMIPTEELAAHPWLKIDAMLLKPYTAETLLWTVEKALQTPAARRHTTA